MGLWDKKKDTKTEEQREYETFVSEFEPKYNMPARTDLVLITNPNGADTFVFRKVERSEKGNWNVHAIEIYDVTKQLKIKAEDLAKKAKVEIDTSEIKTSDDNIVIQVQTLGRKGEDGKTTNEMTYLEAMTLLAELQRRAVDGTANYSFAEPEDIAKILNIADKKLVEAGLVQEEFNDLEYFEDVCDREEIVFTLTDKAQPLQKGRMVYDGRYKLSNIVRAKGKAAEARNNPPNNGMDAELVSAFNNVMMPNKMDSFLTGSRALLEADKIMRNVADTSKAFINLLDSPSASNLSNVLNLADDCEYACDQSHKLSGAYVDKYKQILDRIRLSAYIKRADHLQKSIKQDTANVASCADEIQNIQMESNALVKKLDPYFKSDNAGQLIVDRNFLQTLVDDYNKSRAAYSKKLEERPEDALEDSKVFHSKAQPKKKASGNNPKA